MICHYNECISADYTSSDITCLQATSNFSLLQVITWETFDMFP